MRENRVGAIVIKCFALLVVLGTAHQAMAQDAKTPYTKMPPLDEYLMPHRAAEIALARSAAPESIARDADVLILGRHGFETAATARTVSSVLWDVRGLRQRTLTSRTRRCESRCVSTLQLHDPTFSESRGSRT